ncbi:MAG: dihydroneopterin aldolase [Rhodospirillaceae bacterium]|jgi:7,8-dihydroneopterin aldolase/epimerase/oxygenase|nr:dihydroneopterin aldolase [Rhodospirillaceae bacterium]MBT5373933.1 dihydroneopterin aldolase [Rhodospirillaceae bacterium]MBT5659850.1 dihydroneopterin aldolase [Rhodospirillaceae bacterium]MBT5753032.1 dihydroneopterin aldolase [Rhodospirillaceae bacterium]
MINGKAPQQQAGDEGVENHSGVGARTLVGPFLYRVFVRDLTLTGLIGIHDFEHETPQRVRFNIDLQAEDTCASAADRIENVVSYEEIVNGVKALFARGHVGLVETLAEDIAVLCLEDTRVRSVRIRVEKLDVIAETESVGIEIERSVQGVASGLSKVIALGSVPPDKA